MNPKRKKVISTPVSDKPKLVSWGIRIDKELKRQLNIRAAELDMTVQDYVTEILRQCLEPNPQIVKKKQDT